MRSITASVGLLALVLAACGGNSAEPTAPDASQARGGRTLAAQVSRPIKGKCTTTFNPAPFPPPVHRQTDTGSCIISHLGKTTFYGEQEINFAAGTQRGWRRLTAANGDDLHGEHRGTSSLIGPGLVGFSATMIIVGGTGRFEGARGEMSLEGVASLATSSTKVSITGGRIRY